ncbi:transcriptional regulator, AraC family [Hungatella hathewayi DSM 13479]|uniref:Transcriptional regulator, AraC family n=1 Tax=Hungatella hathewayi DSM 13479 TaxID=566550 RepID=D3AH34_9FIRM|nr:transcriptional regulator, AraC family [Hungatella hathewayi DSM 13479]
MSNQPHRQKNAAESFDICRIKDYIVEHLKEDLSLETIANKFGYNYSYLSTCFSKYVKKGFKQYVNELRIQHACRLLTESETTVSEAGSESGYSSQSYFTQVFKKYTGCTPSAYQLRHGGSDCQMESATLSDVSCIPPETYSHICEKCG